LSSVPQISISLKGTNTNPKKNKHLCWNLIKKCVEIPELEIGKGNGVTGGCEGVGKIGFMVGLLAAS
jgi:hypothetical protein